VQLTAPQGPGAGDPALLEELVELLRVDRESAKDAARAFRSALDGWDSQALLYTLQARPARRVALRHASATRLRTRCAPRDRPRPSAPPATAAQLGLSAPR
jgi:hypothetical protein